jgi:hypothetical protein
MKNNSIHLIKYALINTSFNGLNKINTINIINIINNCFIIFMNPFLIYLLQILLLFLSKWSAN